MPAPEINIGDRVWVDASDIKMTCPSPKFSDKWLGPFKVVKAVGNGVYKLELPPCYSQLHSVFPVVKLELAKTDPFPERPWNDEPPPPYPPDGQRQEVGGRRDPLKHGSSTAASGTWCAGRVMARSTISG
jgi:hypothetical protein